VVGFAKAGEEKITFDAKLIMVAKSIITLQSVQEVKQIQQSCLAISFLTARRMLQKVFSYSAPERIHFLLVPENSVLGNVQPRLRQLFIFSGVPVFSPSRQFSGRVWLVGVKGVMRHVDKWVYLRQVLSHVELSLVRIVVSGNLEKI